MADINKEIDEVATQLEKSHKTPKEVLFDTIRQLGPEGIRAKLPSLEKSERALLLGALEEMKKSTSMDKDYAAKYVQGNIEDTKIQEDKADDDQDEKLVKPENSDVNHQGNKTDGIEGQVIKGKEMSREVAKDKIMKLEEKEHKTKDPKKLVEREEKEHEEKNVEKAHVGFKAVEEHAREEGAEDPKAVAAAVGIKKYGKEGMEAKARAGKMKKSEDEPFEKKMGVPKGVDPEKQERCVKDVKKEGAGKNPYAICNASMKKGEDCMDKEKMMDLKKKVKSGDKEKMKEGLKEMKKALELANPEASPELIKGEMKRLLAEESQDGDAPEMNEKTRANKEDVAALDLGKDNKEAQKKVNDEKQGMKKSVAWTGENDLLKAMSGGRNHHFSLEEYVAEVLKAAEAGEPVQKSEPSKKEDLNDIIAKGGDRTWDHLNTDRLIKANKEKISGKVVKSFQDNEIAQALGLTEEEAKKILGE